MKINNKVNVSRALFRSYGALFAVQMQQNGVRNACRDMYHKSNGKNVFVISLSTIMNIPLKVKVGGCMGTHTQYAINLHFLLDLKTSI